MKIVHLLSTPYFSGPASAVLELASAQRDLGHQVEIQCDLKRKRALSEELLVPQLNARGFFPSPHIELSVKSTPFRMMKDALALRRTQADVIHCHMSHDHLLLGLGGFRQGLRIRSIHKLSALTSLTPAADGFTVPTERAMHRVTDSPAMLLPAVVSPSFVVDEARRAGRKELGLPTGKWIGMVSTFQPSRRHALAVQAFAELKKARSDAQLVLVGDGALKSAVEAQVAMLGLGAAVHFRGYLSGEAYLNQLQCFDELWILGLGNDAAGRAAAEARACGVRVLAVDEGALSLFADVTVEAEAQSIVEASMGAVRRVVTLPSALAIAAQLVDFYRECLAVAKQ
jgi:L-malate glycosyltransferase